MGGQTQPRWVQNRSKNKSRRGLGGVLVGLEGLLVRNPFFGVRNPFFGGALGAVLGSSWERLGGLLGRLAVQDGTRIGNKIDPKID